MCGAELAQAIADDYVSGREILARTARSVFRGSDSPKAFIHYRRPSRNIVKMRARHSLASFFLVSVTRFGETVINRFPSLTFESLQAKKKPTLADRFLFLGS